MLEELLYPRSCYVRGDLMIEELLYCRQRLFAHT